MIYRNGKKISAVYRNGKSIGHIFRNGKLVWQKAKPAAKRVKSVTVSIPAWGTVGRIEWESIFRAVPKVIDNYYCDVTLNGNGVRLRGNGGKHSSTVEWATSGNTAKITVPDSLFLTTDEMYVGLELPFSAKVPSVTKTPTYTDEIDNKNVFLQFAGAPFFNGTLFTIAAMGNGNRTLTVKADLTGASTKASPAVQTSASKDGMSMLFLEKEYKDADFTKMATHKTAEQKKLIPSFYVNLVYQRTGSITGSRKLVSPACSLAFKYKITSVETY